MLKCEEVVSETRAVWDCTDNGGIDNKHESRVRSIGPVDAFSDPTPERRKKRNRQLP